MRENPQRAGGSARIPALALDGTLRRMDADTFIFIALQGYAVLVAAIAAVALAVSRRRHPEPGE